MSQLSQIFTNIANAIRGKTGSNELITPPEMATAIDNIPSGTLNAFNQSVPAVYITYENEINDPPYRDMIYVAIKEDGFFVDLDHLNEAKFIVPIDNRGSSSTIYTTGEEGTTFSGYPCTTGQDFTVTNGKITLNGQEYYIFGGLTVNLADMLYDEGS